MLPRSRISAHKFQPWIGPVFFFGIINFGVTIGCSAAIGYVVDAHRQSADSALGGVILYVSLALWHHGSLVFNYVQQLQKYLLLYYHFHHQRVRNCLFSRNGCIWQFTFKLVRCPRCPQRILHCRRYYGCHFALDDSWVQALITSSCTMTDHPYFFVTLAMYICKRYFINLCSTKGCKANIPSSQMESVRVHGSTEPSSSTMTNSQRLRTECQKLGSHCLFFICLY